MKTSVAIGETVWRGHAALVAGVSASIRIGLAKAQFRAPRDGGKSNHRRGERRNDASNRIVPLSETHDDIIA